MTKKKTKRPPPKPRYCGTCGERGATEGCAECRDWHRTVHNLGAGRQSAALLAMVCEGELPRPDLVIHADTGNERPETVDWIERVAKPMCAHAGIPFLIVSNGNIAEDTLRSVREGSRIANAPYHVTKSTGKGAMLQRLCTSEYKIVPITRGIREELLGIAWRKPVHTKAHPWRVTQWIGIAAEESKRATGNSGLGWSQLTYPLVEMGMTTADCISTLQRLGWPVPVKSACIMCPFRSDASWARLKREAPDVFEQAVEFDDKLRFPEGRGRLNHSYLKGAKYAAFVHKTRKPLGQLALVDDGGGESFGGEC